MQQIPVEGLCQISLQRLYQVSEYFKTDREESVHLCLAQVAQPLHYITVGGTPAGFLTGKRL